MKTESQDIILGKTVLAMHDKDLKEFECQVMTFCKRRDHILENKIRTDYPKYEWANLDNKLKGAFLFLGACKGYSFVNEHKKKGMAVAVACKVLIETGTIPKNLTGRDKIQIVCSQKVGRGQTDSVITGARGVAIEIERQGRLDEFFN